MTIDGSRKRDHDDDSSGSELSSNEDAAQSDEDSERKERVLHTRVPAVLERELKRLAESLRVPVSNLVRTVLEDAVALTDQAGGKVEQRLKTIAENLESERGKLRKKVLRDPLDGVIAFQSVKLAQPTECAKCEKTLKRGTSANLGITDDPKLGAPRVFVCDDCIPND